MFVVGIWPYCWPHLRCSHEIQSPKYPWVLACPQFMPTLQVRPAIACNLPTADSDAIQACRAVLSPSKLHSLHPSSPCFYRLHALSVAVQLAVAVGAHLPEVGGACPGQEIMRGPVSRLATFYVVTVIGHFMMSR